MGSPQENEFTVKVAIGADGQPIGLQYYDSEGCGHESGAFALTTELRELVEYHDGHRVRSHKLPARKGRCQANHFGVQCSLKEGHESPSNHPQSFSKKHRFEW